MKLTKFFFAFVFLFMMTSFCRSQTNYPQNQPAIGLGVVQQTGFPFSFTFEGKKVGHYALGWYDDPLFVGAPMAYLSGYGGIRFFLNGSTKVFFSPVGNVGIGTTTPQERLSVNGNIRAKEVKVEITGWPDYVFKGDYTLMPLADLEAHIKAHGHLPGIPSAKEAEADGIGLAEMNRKLLEKVEELTLHLIEKDRALQCQGTLLARQQDELQELKAAQTQTNTLLERLKHLIP